MHELAICQSLLSRVEQTARAHKATGVSKVCLSIGPLSGVEPPLLERAWTIARAGTIARQAPLSIHLTDITVRCSQCGHEGPALVNKLRCEKCRDWRVTLLGGDEMVLTSLELEENQQEATPAINARKGVQ